LHRDAKVAQIVEGDMQNDIAVVKVGGILAVTA
jgi:hypothetical protein